MADVSSVKSSSSTDPYTTQTYSAASNDKNTLSITSYFKLLSAQLANQDMSNPMSTSDMMNQMSQMAMVQSLAKVTESLTTVNSMSKQSYAASMIGREVTYNGTSYKAEDGTTVADGTRTGMIESVNFSGDEPTFRVSGDPNEYKLSSITKVNASIGTEETDKTEEEKKAEEEKEAEAAEKAAAEEKTEKAEAAEEAAAEEKASDKAAQDNAEEVCADEDGSGQ